MIRKSRWFFRVILAAVLAVCGSVSAEVWVSVKDFGAMGDGVTDDTTEIQNAIDSGSDGVYFPPGIYVTSAPLHLRSDLTLLGDAGQNNSTILCFTDHAALVCWEGAWDEPTVDWNKVWPADQKNCNNLALKNLKVLAYADYAFYTLGVACDNLRISDCWFVSNGTARWAFASTGFLTNAVVERSSFGPRVKLVADDPTVLPCVDGVRFTDCLFGISGFVYDDWRVELRGCIRNSTFESILFEATPYGFLLDADRDGTGNVFNNIWGFDTHAPESHMMRVEAAAGLSIKNVMGFSYLTLINNGNVSDVYLQSVRISHIMTNGVPVTAYDCWGLY